MASQTPIATPVAASPSDWFGTAGDRWAVHVDHHETMLAAVADVLIARAGFAPGERVVEIGCGGGALTRAIAAAVAPGGTVTGLDISAALVDLAAGRAAAERLDNCRFVRGDAQVARPEGIPFDRLVSRFGIMFFTDPAAAMANLHAMLRPGGRLDVAVWAPAADNPMFTIVMGAMRTHVAILPPPPRAPGPLAFSEADYFEGLLAGAGFSAIRFEPWRGRLHLGHGGADVAEATRRLLATGSAADALADATPAVREAVRRDVEAALARYEDGDGVALPAAVHLVSAVA